jgi:hypothetical protein
MNLKNHTGERPFVLSGDQGEAPAFAHSKTFKFFTKDLPSTVGRLATYLLGFLVTVEADYVVESGESIGGGTYDWDDVARALFESFELKNSLLGKPISHNFHRGEFTGLFGFVGNGMQRPVPQPPSLDGQSHEGATPRHQRHSWYVPASSMLGMKGHHTAQLACLFDNATFEVKTAAAGTVPGLIVVQSPGFSPVMNVTAILVAEPEIRLGPGVQFVRYASTIAQTGTKHVIEALGNTSSFQGVEEGAGIAFLAWMSSRRGYGGSFSDATELEYLNLPFRGLDQLIHLDALYTDYLGACTNNEAVNVQVYDDATGLVGNAGPFAGNGLLYGPSYYGLGHGLLDADFVPLVSPKRFMEVSKLQSVQGSQDLYAKYNGQFRGDDVFVALQYHSWNPATQEEVFKKILSSGVAAAVWGTTDLVPSTKIVNKQPAGGLNPSKTRYFAHTWQPRETQQNPPSVSAPK